MLKRAALITGPVAFALLVLMPPFPSFHDTASSLTTGSSTAPGVEELMLSMQVVFALLVWMVIWWLTEAVPLPVTALLPATLLPWFHLVGVSDGKMIALTMKNILVNYANPVIYLFLGGFLLAAAMQKWKLDKRLTLWLLTRRSLANDARLVVLGMMWVTAFLSMWMSNSATAAMMLPLGFGILSLTSSSPGESKLGICLMLGIAWAASIGGVGTIIGTPPNGIALGILNAAFTNTSGYHPITFLEWMSIGVPYVVLFIPVAWFVLITIYPPEHTMIPGGKERLAQERSLLGSMAQGEKLTIAVYAFVIFLWISNQFWEHMLPLSVAGRLAWVDEYTIGLFGGVLLFVVPVKPDEGEFLLSWSDTKFVDWGTLLLFGGGIALSDALFKTGVASWIATSVVAALGTPSTLAMMVIVVLLICLLTEVTSNTAVTSMMVPVIISIALKTGGNAVTLSVAAALAASMAFMLPVATPPNALVFGTGYVRINQMIRAGAVLEVLGWMFTLAVILVFGHWIFGVLQF
jgi:sodium-dependent dicarboxylate transporter 2/3/5